MIVSFQPNIKINNIQQRKNPVNFQQGISQTEIKKLVKGYAVPVINDIELGKYLGLVTPEEVAVDLEKYFKTNPAVQNHPNIIMLKNIFGLK